MTPGGPTAGTSARSSIPGVRWGRVVSHGDNRGSFRELWRASWFPDLDAGRAGSPDPRFVQANLSTSAPGVLRGLHLHRRQLDYWIVAGGRALVALVDIRPLLEERGPAPIVEMRELDTGRTVEIPIGVAHGFLALDALSLVYLVTGEYDGSDELGFAWDDPVAGVPWPAVADSPDGRPILSGRDGGNPPLLDLVDRIRSG